MQRMQRSLEAHSISGSTYRFKLSAALTAPGPSLYRTLVSTSLHLTSPHPIRCLKTLPDIAVERIPDNAAVSLRTNISDYWDRPKEGWYIYIRALLKVRAMYFDLPKCFVSIYIAQSE